MLWKSDDDKKNWDDTKVLVAEKEPFFAAIAFGLNEVLTKTLPTLATDGKSLFVNPDFLAGRIRFQQAVFRLHEIAHVALKHPVHLQGKWRFWNEDPTTRPFLLEAMDHVVNNWIMETATWVPKEIWEQSFNFAPPNAPPQSMDDFKGFCYAQYKGWTTEQVMDDLLKNKKKQKKGGHGPGHGHCCQTPEVGDGKGGTRPMTEAEVRELEAKLDDLVIQAAKIAKARGTVPAGMERLVNDILYPKEDPLDKIRRLVRGRVPTNYTFHKPNKRHAWRGIYLPSMEKTGIGRMAFAVDTSGSMHPEELSLAWGTVREVLEEKAPETLFLVFSDAAVANVQEFEYTDDLPEFKAAGGGGTDFGPVFEWAKGEQLDLLVYFTDLECPAAELQDPGIPVIWICSRREEDVNAEWKPRFGEIVHVTAKR